MQRAMDIVLASIALLVLSPLLLPIVLVLRLSGEGEIFYLQTRIGKGGDPFDLYKFATMLKNSPNLGTGTITLKNDPRVLPLGQFLRKTKINELPQLLNIVKGDMSIIGPRPQTERSYGAFAPKIKELVAQVRPGLSGVGSIVFRDEEELLHGQKDPMAFYDRAIMPYKGAVEEWYVANQGLWVYGALIGLTVWVVLFPRSNMLRKVFRTLPVPEGELAAAFGKL